MKRKLLKRTTSLLLVLFALGFTAKAQNLLNQDPNFEEGNPGEVSWKWYSASSPNITRETTSPQNGLSYLKAITTVGGNYWDLGVSNYQTLNAASSPVLEAGKTYILSFYYQNTAGHTFQAGLQDNSGKAPYDFFETISAEATSWTLYTYEFTATAALVAAVNDVRVKFQFGKDLGTTLIDNVQLKSAIPPVPQANVVLNNSFETDNGGAGLFKNWATSASAPSNITAGTSGAKDGSRYLRADVSTAGNAWDVQAYSDNFAVTPGHNYSVSFWYKSDKNIRLVLQGPTTFYNATDIPASSTPGTWVKFEKTLNYGASETETLMSLKFHLNVDNGFAEIDNVSVNDLVTLPVTLTSFTAKPSLNSVTLNWATSAEINNDYYQVLRAGDDQVFSSVSTQTANNKASTYTFIDKAPLKGNNYYKLLQYDKDGKVSDLGTRVADFNIDNEVTVYPNPASEWVGFDLGNYAGKTVKVTLTETSGRLVINQNIVNQSRSNKIQLPTGLTPGIYSLTITGEGLNKVSKLVIQ